MNINNASDAYNLILDKLGSWLHDLIRLLPNIVLAAIIMTLGLFVANWIKKLSSKIIRRISVNHAINNLFSSIIYITFIGITVFAVLSVLQLDKAVTSILAGAGIVGLALAFAFQDMAANFICGIFISFRNPLNIGDIVKISDYMGRVESINLRDTVLRTFQGQLVIIPNKDVFQNPIENYSLLGMRRFDLSVGISYGDDLEKVKNITLAAVQGINNVSADNPPTLFFTQFGDSSINFILRLWVNSPDQPVYLQVGSDAIMRIKQAYDDNDIMIPFPIRTLDFGIKGGQTIAEMPLTVASKQHG